MTQHDSTVFVGALHLLFSFLIAFYGIVFPRNPWDAAYVGYVFLLVFSWTSMHGECLISYWVKIAEEPGYVAGLDPNRLSDFDAMGFIVNTFMNPSNQSSSPWYDVFAQLPVLEVLNYISLYLVMQRNQFSVGFILATILMITTYNRCVKWFHTSLHEKTEYLLLQEFYKVYFFFGFLIVLYHFFG